MGLNNASQEEQIILLIKTRLFPRNTKVKLKYFGPIMEKPKSHWRNLETWKNGRQSKNRLMKDKNLMTEAGAYKIQKRRQSWWKDVHQFMMGQQQLND